MKLLYIFISIIRIVFGIVVGITSDGYTYKETKEYADEQAAVAAAYASQTNQRNQRADDRAQKQALAIRADGQGGGTEVPFDDTPMLSGFVIPANPQY